MQFFKQLWGGCLQSMEYCHNRETKTAMWHIRWRTKPWVILASFSLELSIWSSFKSWHSHGIQHPSASVKGNCRLCPWSRLWLLTIREGGTWQRIAENLWESNDSSSSPDKWTLQYMYQLNITLLFKRSLMPTWKRKDVEQGLWKVQKFITFQNSCLKYKIWLAVYSQTGLQRLTNNWIFPV